MTGAEVRRIRARLQLTQAALARALGVSRVTVADRGVRHSRTDRATASADPQRKTGAARAIHVM